MDLIWVFPAALVVLGALAFSIERKKRPGGERAEAEDSSEDQESEEEVEAMGSAMLDGKFTAGTFVCKDRKCAEETEEFSELGRVDVPFIKSEAEGSDFIYESSGSADVGDNEDPVEQDVPKTISMPVCPSCGGPVRFKPE